MYIVFVLSKEGSWSKWSEFDNESDAEIKYQELIKACPFNIFKIVKLIK